MDIMQTFPEKYLKSEGLNGKKLKLKISHVSIEKMGNDNKPVMYFDGKEKGLVLNKTKAAAMAASFGRETDLWKGAEVVIYPSTTMMEGKMVASIALEPYMPIAEGEDENF